MSSRLDVTSLGSFIREQREAAEVSLRQLAKTSGVSNPYLSQIERGLRNPSAEILGQIARALRISAETLYVQAGFLEEREDREPAPSFTVALAADPTLTERQRGVLLEIYTAFMSENAASRARAEPETPVASKRSTTKRADRPATS